MNTLIHQAVLLAILPVAFIIACRETPPESSPDLPNIIIIGVDTLRADHVGCYGYQRDTTPNIDDFANQGVLFKNCLTPCPRTTQSICSIMTGKYPWNHGVRNLHEELPEEADTLAEVLKDSGYKTISILANGLVSKKVDQGFEVIWDIDSIDNPDELFEFDAKKATDLAISELSEIQGRYFLWIFYMDPHMPYLARGLPFDNEYEGRFKWMLSFDEIPHGELFFKNPMTEREREHAIALYDSEIRYLDREIGRLLKYINIKDDNNIIVFTADHGEGLGEHNYYYDHGDLLNQPSLHVPLIISGINFPEKIINKIVRLIDIFPTILSRLSIDADKYNFDGVDLLDFLNKGSPDLKAFSETGRAIYKEVFEAGHRKIDGLAGRLRSVVYRGQKLTYLPTSDGIEWRLYDLKNDPGELHDIFPANPDPVIINLMNEVSGIARIPAGPQKMPELNKKDLERLRALGYAE
jgi:arylsulfatase A-like enzyme